VIKHLHALRLEAYSLNKAISIVEKAQAQVLPLNKEVAGSLERIAKTYRSQHVTLSNRINDIKSGAFWYQEASE